MLRTKAVAENELRVGSRLIVNDNFTITTRDNLYVIKKGWRVVVVDLFNRKGKTLVKLKGDFVMGTTLEKVTQMFDLIVD